jgi:RHS repeat-associated protein
VQLDSQGRVERRVIYFNLRPVALLQYGHSNSSKNTDTTHTTPESAQRLAIHGDHLGTPQAITDERQRVVWLAQYDAFGRATAQGLPSSEVTAQNRSNRSTERSWIGSAHADNAASAPADKPFEFHLRFAGQYEDSETGWHYNWHRFYDPDTGRYLTPDPIGLRGGDNAFGYAAGDPFGLVDPDGLQALPPAAAYNPPLLAPTTYGARAQQYQRMQQELLRAGVDIVWFGVAAELNQAFEDTLFGLVPGDVGPGDWMNDLGMWLWQHNRATYLQILATAGTGSCVGDYALVEREQLLVQQYIGQSPPSVVARTQINIAFAVGRGAMPSYLGQALRRVEATTADSYGRSAQPLPQRELSRWISDVDMEAGFGWFSRADWRVCRILCKRTIHRWREPACP